jgi:hypothetical protein
VSFLVTTDGGSGVLYSTNGTQFTLTVPPLTVLDVEVVTMTVVTNVGALPFSQGILGAVRLEPDGLPLWDAATLEISLPPGLDLRKIVSFTSEGDGSSFHLTPDRVTTNSVLIPVTQLGLFGSALALDTEVPALSSAASSSAFVAHPTQRFARKRRYAPRRLPTPNSLMNNFSHWLNNIPRELRQL